RETTASAAGPGPTVDAETLTAIAEAAYRHEQLRFDYLDRAGGETRRRAEPHRPVYTGRRWYLPASDVDRDGWRTYPAAPIRPRGPNGPSFTPKRPPEEAVAHVLRGLGQTAWRYRAVIRLHAPVEAAAELLPPGSGLLEAAGDGETLWRTGSDTLRDLANYISALELPFTVEGPPELR